MSFLAGRLAVTEGSYFLKESKQAVARIIETHKDSVLKSVVSEKAANDVSISSADVLPEVLRHSLPPKMFHSPPESYSAVKTPFSGASKWALKLDGVRGVSSDKINPLTAYVSLPQATFGPRRWQLPSSGSGVLPSTANDLRQDRYVAVNPEKLKAAAAGLSHIGSAFAIATGLVFGGSAVIFSLLASKFELHTTDDIRIKGKELVHAGLADTLREQLSPMRSLAEDLSKKWHLEREEAATLKEKPLLIKQLSRNLSAPTNPRTRTKAS